MFGNLAILAIVLATSLTATRLLIDFADRHGCVAYPRGDRWHKKPTALYGGVAIFAAFIIGLAGIGPAVWSGHRQELIGLVTGSALVFAIGLRDDVKPLNPLLKLVGQVMACTVFLVGLGLAHSGANSQLFLLSLPVAILWTLGLTNAFNLLDNMDGLTAGTSVVVAGVLTLFLAESGLGKMALISAVVAVTCAGFLIFNFRPWQPARIFMGDCGSMFLGFMLAGLSLVGAWQVVGRGLHLLAIPLLIMALPIFDTTLVTIFRKREGRSISQGGKDHSSHRLVYAGLDEKKAVVALVGISLAAGGAGLLVWRVNQLPLSLVVLGGAALGLVLFGVYLGRFPPRRMSTPELAAAPPSNTVHPEFVGRPSLVSYSVLAKE